MISEDEDGFSTPTHEAFNISNDLHYQPVTALKPEQRLKLIQEELGIPKYGSSTIQHSLPAYDLWPPFFPAYLSEEKFKVFHRPKLRHYNTGPQSRRSRQREFPIKNLTRTLYKFQKKLRNKVALAINQGLTRNEINENILHIHRAKDLTAKQGELFLFEYCEEHPPVLSQVGMASNVKTYIQSSVKNNLNVTACPTARPQNLSSETTSPQKKEQDISNETNVEGSSLIEQKGNYKIGIDQVIYEQNATKQIYYHKLKSGDRLQVIENNMYRAPIFKHEVSSCDFLVIRTRNNFYIRGIKTIFVVGQTMPLVTIPKPSESAIQRFRVDLSNRYIHKLFLESATDPPSLSLERLLKTFPDYSRTVLRSRLIRNGSVNSGSDGIFYRGSSKFGLIPLKELRRVLTPEQYCLSMASLAARERLRALNYTESMINHTIDAEIEAEILAAPWNTSEAVLSTLKGRHYLDFKGHLIDPTGPQREGFSCIPWVRSPTEAQQARTQKEESNSKDKPSMPSSKLTPVSLQNPLGLKIRREKLERLATYQKEAQLIYDVQANVLKSQEVLSSDEEEDDEGEDDKEDDDILDEQIRDLDRLVTGGRTLNELNFEKEEEERRQMLRDFNQNGIANQRFPLKDANIPKVNKGSLENKILRITRIYKTPDGVIERTEIVREPKIIALYIKQKSGNLESSQNNENESQPQQINSKEDGSFVRVEKRHNMSLQDLHKTALGSNNINSRLPARRQSINLGPTELCRAEGLRLTISKSVLNPREMRRRRRHSILE